MVSCEVNSHWRLLKLLKALNWCLCKKTFRFVLFANLKCICMCCLVIVSQNQDKRMRPKYYFLKYQIKSNVDYNQYKYRAKDKATFLLKWIRLKLLSTTTKDSKWSVYSLHKPFEKSIFQIYSQGNLQTKWKDTMLLQKRNLNVFIICLKSWGGTRDILIPKLAGLQNAKLCPHVGHTKTNSLVHLIV